MKFRVLHAFSSAAVSLLLLLALTGVGFAHEHGHGHEWDRDHDKRHRHHHAPELDPALISNGLTLLAGSALLLVERKRRRS
jgi:hypothetical protein